MNTSLCPQNSLCTSILSYTFSLTPHSLRTENTVSGWEFPLTLRHFKGKYRKMREVNVYSFPNWILQSKLLEKTIHSQCAFVPSCLSLILPRIKCSPCARPKWKYDLMFVYCVAFLSHRPMQYKVNFDLLMLLRPPNTGKLFRELAVSVSKSSWIAKVDNV